MPFERVVQDLPGYLNRGCLIGAFWFKMRTLFYPKRGLFQPALRFSLIKVSMTDRKKILVVEDNDFVRMQIIRFLSEAGFDAVETTDGNAALDKMGPEIAMAIVDIRMEPIDGFEFIRTVRGRDIHTPVVLVTGDNTPDLLNEAAKWGVAAVLMKPVQRDRLVMTVTRTLQAQERVS